MSRSSKNSRRFTPQIRIPRQGTLLLSALTAAALSGGLLPAASLAAGYVFQQHTLNAGVLVTGPGPVADPAPYLFYVLNNRPDVRPPDLTLVNPLAPALTNPNTPAYWEVPLNTISDGELSQYNVLYLRADGISFGPVINEKLRRFADNGGQLIVEYGAAASAVGLFAGAGTTAGPEANVSFPFVGASAGAPILRQPIVSQPYFLSLSDLTTFSTPLPVTPTVPSPLNLVQFWLSANGADILHGPEFSSIFSPALTATNGTVVATAQIGAGQVVTSTLNIGAGISVEPAYQALGANGVLQYQFNPADLYLAPAADLKLLTNILSWSETHPSDNKTSHGNASNNGLASFSPAWQYLPMTAGTAAPSGAAVWGNFVFSVDATGILHAFDAYPSENLTGNTTTQGAEIGTVTPQVSQYPLTSYDEIWNSSKLTPPVTIGTGASTPTVASFGGVNSVFVERKDGSVVAFNAVTGTALALPAAPVSAAAGGTTPTYPLAGAANAPGPTFYDGRLYAGQPNGLLHVYDLNEGTSAAVTLEANQNIGSGTEYVTGAPAVGTLTSGDTNVLVAVVPTNYNIYTVVLGARNEALKEFDANGSIAGYSINRLGRYDLNNIFADTSSVVPPLLAYDYNGNIYPNTASPLQANSTAPNPQDPLFSIANISGYYTDWNTDFAASAGTGTNPNQVNLNYISANSYGELQNPVAALAFSAPAIDRRGNYYYTETAGTSTTGASGNSYVVGVANAPLHTNVHVKFRFRMPTAADNAAPLSWDYIDADRVNYRPLIGFQFVGAPVVDDKGNVYVAATNGASGTAASATVLCFRGDQAVSAIDQQNPLDDLTQDTITQPDEGGGDDNTIQRGPDANVGTAGATYGQYLASPPAVTGGAVTSPSSITFYNFGKRGRTFAEIAGNLTEPQPVTATSTDGSGTKTSLPMQTNLAWYMTPFALTTPVSGTFPANTTPTITGLSLVGSSLFLCDGTSLYRVPTNPQIGTGKVVTASPAVTPLGAGLVGAPPSIGGSVMVINGTNGIAARTRQVTVIADSNRVLGVDGDGSAVWSVDATTRTDLTATPPVSTRVPFSHPTSLSAFAVNDYLAADTGTNRCVRFDSGGNVQWELTRFQDPYGLMALGQPLTLNQPSSVVTRTVSISPTATINPGGTITYYLVADSGNNRVLEVADTFDQNGNLVQPSHVLTWVSHTADQGGRSYRYGNAAYYANTTSPSGYSIAATVTNTRLAPLTRNAAGMVTGLGSISGDAPGGSLVVFNYPQTPVSYSNLASAPADLIYTTAGFYTASGTGTNTTYTPSTIRNPRFLQLVSSPTASAPVNSSLNPNNVPAFNFLYADDNGVFDLSYDATKGAFVAGADRLQFRPTDYQAMTAPTDAPTTNTNGLTFSRTGLPFIASYVQALSTDSQVTNGSPGTATGGSANVTRRYLVTQSYSQGELGTPSATGKIGGEVFEVDVTASLTYPASSVSGTIPPPTVNATPPPSISEPGGFGSVLVPAVGNVPAANLGSTLSHPALTGPLTQPTTAVRLP